MKGRVGGTKQVNVESNAVMPDAGGEAFVHYGRIVIVARFDRTVS
jgi:hypothetical protein